jgi:SsrA-binding protein
MDHQRKGTPAMGEKLVAQNRRARHDYHILEHYEAGIELRGTEVKSLRNGHITLKDSYAEVEDGEMRLIGVHINPYEQGNIFNHEPERPRRLLMHKREILRLGARVAEKGLTLIPLRVYFKEGRAKVEIGLCQGKHVVDKRETLREREVKREIDRATKQQGRRPKENRAAKTD